MATSITHARLRKLLNYDSKTGRFTWRVDRQGHIRAGDIAGTITRSGYRQIRIDQEFFSAGPLAVFWMTGRWPPNFVDHINMERDDNRWTNLRLANNSQNHANGRARTSGLKGVTWDRSRAKYAARIKVNYRTINLGRFDDPEEAHAAYVAAARKHFGEFARAR